MRRSHFLLLIAGAIITTSAQAFEDSFVRYDLASNTATPPEVMQRFRDAANPNNKAQSQRSKAEQIYQKGNEFRAQGEIDLAIAEYSEAIKLNANHANAHYNRGLSWEQKGALEQALSDYRRYRELAPNDNRAQLAIRRIVERMARDSKFPNNQRQLDQRRNDWDKI